MADPIAQIEVPEGHEIVKDTETGAWVIRPVESKADKIAARIATLETELAGMTEPTDQELIEEGKMMHPYYMVKEEIEMLKGSV